MPNLGRWETTPVGEEPVVGESYFDADVAAVLVAVVTVSDVRSENSWSGHCCTAAAVVESCCLVVVAGLREAVVGIVVADIASVAADDWVLKSAAACAPCLLRRSDFHVPVLVPNRSLRLRSCCSKVACQTAQMISFALRDRDKRPLHSRAWQVEP